MIRTSCQDLATCLRSLIGDAPDGSNASALSDDVIQGILDDRSLYYAPPFPSGIGLRLTPGNPLGAGEWYSNITNWDADATITDINGAAVTVTNADPLNGRWVIADYETNHPGLSLFVTGRTYDLWGAAADGLTVKATNAARKVDADTGDIKISRSQESRQLLEMAREYRKKARPRKISMSRSDVPQWGNGGYSPQYERWEAWRYGAVIPIGV